MLYLVLDVIRNRARTDESFAAAGRQVAVLEHRVHWKLWPSAENGMAANKVGQRQESRCPSSRHGLQIESMAGPHGS